jgi:hypothetical protein
VNSVPLVIYCLHRRKPHSIDATRTHQLLKGEIYIQRSHQPVEKFHPEAFARDSTTAVAHAQLHHLLRLVKHHVFAVVSGADADVDEDALIRSHIFRAIKERAFVQNTARILSQDDEILVDEVDRTKQREQV